MEQDFGDNGVCTALAQGLGVLWFMFQYKWGVPGPELCLHGSCWGTGSRIGGSCPSCSSQAGERFLIHRQIGASSGEQNHPECVTCGNAHPSSWSIPCTPGTQPRAGNEPFLRLPAQTGGERPRCAASRRSQEELKPAPVTAAQPPPACPALVLPTAGS